MSAIRLYCLPHSGASAMVYSRWARKLPDWISVHPVELPGRGMRMAEALQTDMSDLVPQLAAEIGAKMSRYQPYALFGHSLGALVAFELAHALSQSGFASPKMLFASGTAAPTRREDYEDEYSVPKSDAELISDLRELQGTPEEVLANQELMDLTLPVMRADYLLCGNYKYEHTTKNKLGCPLHVLAGKDDKATKEQLLAWHQETSSATGLSYFDGGHFFTQERESDVLALLSQALAAVTGRAETEGYQSTALVCS